MRRPGRVVAADPLARSPAEPQPIREVARVRAGRRVDDRVVPDLLELVVVPFGPLAALVLGISDLDRVGRKRLLDAVDGEDDLDALPVALVLVVEVVEVVVEPVLDGELTLLGHDVDVGRRRLSLGKALPVLRVGAARPKRVAWEVEEVVGPLLEEVRGRRRLLHDRVALAGTAQAHLGIAEARSPPSWDAKPRRRRFPDRMARPGPSGRRWARSGRPAPVRGRPRRPRCRNEREKHSSCPGDQTRGGGWQAPAV